MHIKYIFHVVYATIFLNIPKSDKRGFMGICIFIVGQKQSP
jgi:hypothetical protein